MKYHIIFLIIIMVLITVMISESQSTREANLASNHIRSVVSIGGCVGQECVQAVGYDYSSIEYDAVFLDDSYAYIVMTDTNNKNTTIIKYNITNIWWFGYPPPGIPPIEWDVQDRQVIAEGALQINFTTLAHSIWEPSFNGSHILVPSVDSNGEATIAIVNVTGKIPELSKIIHINMSYYDEAISSRVLDSVMTSNTVYLLVGSNVACPSGDYGFMVALAKINLATINLEWIKTITTPCDPPQLSEGELSTYYGMASKLYPLNNGSLVITEDASIRINSDYTPYTLIFTLSPDGSIISSKAIHGFAMATSDGNIYSRYDYFAKYSSGPNLDWAIRFITKYSGKSSGPDEPVYAYVEEVKVTPDGQKFVLSMGEPTRIIAVVNSQNGGVDAAYITKIASSYSGVVYGLSTSKGYILYSETDENDLQIRLVPSPLLDYVNLTSLEYDIINVSLPDNPQSPEMQVGEGSILGATQYNATQINYEALTRQKRIYLVDYPPLSPPLLVRNPSLGIYRYGTYDVDVGSYVLKNDEGNTYLIGVPIYSYIEGSYGGYNIFIYKISENGSIIDNRIIWTSRNGRVVDAMIGADGYIYIVKSAYSFPDESRDGVVVKVNPDTLKPEWIIEFDDGLIGISCDPTCSQIYLVGTERFYKLGDGYYPNKNANMTIIILDNTDGSPTVSRQAYYWLVDHIYQNRVPGAFMATDIEYVDGYIYVTALQNFTSGGVGTELLKIDPDTFNVVGNITYNFDAGTYPYTVVSANSRLVYGDNKLMIIGAKAVVNAGSGQIVDVDAAIMAVPTSLDQIAWCRVLETDSGQNYTDSFMSAMYNNALDRLYVSIQTEGMPGNESHRRIAVAKIDPQSGWADWVKGLTANATVHLVGSVWATEDQVLAVFNQRLEYGAYSVSYSVVDLTAYYSSCSNPGAWHDTVLLSRYELRSGDHNVYVDPTSSKLSRTLLVLGNLDTELLVLDQAGDPIPIPEPAIYVSTIIALTAVAAYYIVTSKSKLKTRPPT